LTENGDGMTWFHEPCRKQPRSGSAQRKKRGY